MQKKILKNLIIFCSVDRNGFVNSSNLGIAPLNEETRSESKRSGVTFKIPDSDDHLGKSVGDIAAGK